MNLRIAAVAILFSISCARPAERLSPTARQAFANYIADYETRLASRRAERETYIASLDVSPSLRAALERDLMAGALHVEAVNGGTRNLGNALLHDWRGTAFAPGATAAGMLSLLRDYDGFAQYYAPFVIASRATADRGGCATVLMRLEEGRRVRLVFDTEYALETGLLGDKCGYAASRSRHVWQVEDAGTVHEHRRPEGADDGFLWRINTYWTFAERRNGLFMECESISLTRAVPWGLGWLIEPIIGSLPASSMGFTLAATKRALCSRAVGVQGCR